ncbi:MAG: hypothetical protein Q7S86_00215 [bacterium]|nr:hypothetical protein [bacterium]
MKTSTLTKSVISFILIVLCSLGSLRAGHIINPIVYSAVVVGIVVYLLYGVWDKIPNGKPRPEEELKRGVVYHVHATSPSLQTTIEAGLGSESVLEGTFWRFSTRNLDAPRLKPGDRFLYLDDPNQYSKNWGSFQGVDEGVIMILSEKGRTAEKDNTLRNKLEQNAKDVSLGILD